MEHFYESIHGWFTYDYLYKEQVERAKDGARFVEVGSYLGRSAAYMAVEIANSGKNIEFFAVDIWDDPESRHADAWRSAEERNIANSTFSVFQSNIEPAKHIIQPIRKTSVAAAADFDDGSLDFVFIDAGHDYENVRADICAWLPKLKPGGILAGHDMDNLPNWPQVRTAVEGALPFGNVSCRPGWVWYYRNALLEWGSWSVPYTGKDDYLIFIPVVNGVDLLKDAVASVIDHAPNVIVVDQTVEGLGDLWGGRVGVFRAQQKASFTQMQNWAIDLARFSGKKYLCFMHNDAVCLDGASVKAIEKARALDAAGQKWSIIFTQETDGLSHYGGLYDFFCVFSMEAISHTGRWDETFMWYVSDCDWYRRLALHGYPTVGLPEAKVKHRHSQTITIDASIRAHAQARQKHDHDHYRHKWGGGPDAEKYSIPYNGKP